MVRAVFETNVFGVIAVTNAMLPLLRRSPAPRIVNVSSGAASLAIASNPDGPLAGLPASAAYSPSKTALNALTVQYAMELRKDGILVNAADPGYVDTDINAHHGYLTSAQGASRGAPRHARRRRPGSSARPARCRGSRTHPRGPARESQPEPSALALAFRSLPAVRSGSPMYSSIWIRPSKVRLSTRSRATSG